MKKFFLDLQMFTAVTGNEPNVLTNAQIGYVNGVLGTNQTFPDANGNTLAPTLKTYYDMDLLENAREEFIFNQLGMKIPLPANHGTKVEKRKWDTLPLLDKLKEGTIPAGKKLSMKATEITLAQYGQYVTVSDLLDLHAVDDVVLGATEELGAAAGKSMDRLTRNALNANTNVIYAPGKTTQSGALKPFQPTSNAELYGLEEGGLITPTLINKVVTKMKKDNVPFFTGRKYVAVIHPSVAYDLREDAYWIDVHKYSATEEIFNGEIGELHGVRFIENNDAPVFRYEPAGGTNVAYYYTYFFGKDAFGVVSPEGGNLETIIKTRDQVGGPLNQFSTIGCKVETGAKVLYPERVLCLRTLSTFSGVDEPNETAIDVDYTPTT